MYADAVLFLKGFPYHPQGRHAQTGGIEGIHSLMGSCGRMGGFSMHINGFSHKTGAGAVAQH